MRDIIINKRKIGLNEPIFLIAEVGVNHNGDLGLAKKLIDVATIAKVDAVKFQTFITDEVFADSTPKVNYQKDSKEDQETFNEMVKKYEFSKDNFKELKVHLHHDIVCTWYGEKSDPENVAIECTDCQEVLVSYDKDENEMDKEA